MGREHRQRSSRTASHQDSMPCNWSCRVHALRESLNIVSSAGDGEWSGGYTGWQRDAASSKEEGSEYWSELHFEFGFL